MARDAGPTVCPARPPARAASYTAARTGRRPAFTPPSRPPWTRLATATWSRWRRGRTPASAPVQRLSRNSYYHSAMVIQTVYINKSITIRGGYTTAFADPPDPDANPTTLDAQGQGRVIFITGNVSTTIEGLRITGGNAAGLGGRPWSKGIGADDSGGGVYAIDVPLNFRNNQVFGNTARYGGGMYLRSSGATSRGTSSLQQRSRVVPEWKQRQSQR